MNKTRIEWADFQWNPITGCRQGCRFCYLDNSLKRFSGDVKWNLKNGKYVRDGEVIILEEKYMSPSAEEPRPLNTPFGSEPTYHRYRLSNLETLKMTRRILVCGDGEMFGPWIPDWIIQEIFDSCLKSPKHHYLFLTRFPNRYTELAEKGMLPTGKKFWYGYSVPTANNEAPFMRDGYKTFAVYEPLIEIKNPAATDWIITGAEQTKDKKKRVNSDDVSDLVAFAAMQQIPIFMTDSLSDVVGNQYLRKQFPPELEITELGDGHFKIRYSICSECGRTEKNDRMANLYVKTKREESAVKLVNMCRTCFEKFCMDRNVEIPKLKGFKD